MIRVSLARELAPPTVCALSGGLGLIAELLIVIATALVAFGERSLHFRIRILPLDFFNHGRPGEHGVFVVAGGEAEVLAEEPRIFSREVVGEIGPCLLYTSRDGRRSG